MPLKQGQIVQNRYRIEEPIGEGGFGAVYRAWDTAVEHPCAIKENLDITEEAQRQFHREASILAGLRHPNLPRVTDHFILPDQGQYLVMDFVEGKSLAEILSEEEDPLPEKKAVPWFEQICQALDHLHSRTPPIIHRDIKPQNIIITPSNQAVLVDFGISKLYDPEMRTVSGARATSPGFSPVEQYGLGRTDARTDIYALAATLYTSLTAQLPLDAYTRITEEKELTPPQEINPKISSGVEQAILKGMALNPEDRFQTTKEFQTALTLPAESEPMSLSQSQLTEKYRGPLAAFLTFLVVVILGLLILYFLLPSASAPSEPTNNINSAGSTSQNSPAPETEVAVVSSPTVTSSAADFPAPTSSATPAATTALPTASPTPTTSPTSAIPQFSWITIPAGNFIMGSNEADIQRALTECNATEGNCRPEWFSSEIPRRTEWVSEFQITRYEITNAQYNRCVEAGVCQEAGRNIIGSDARYDAVSFRDDYPVVGVTWRDASTFCQWIGGRLPTEAEWEKAARGTNGRRYPWGDSYEAAKANLASGMPQPVGSFPAGGSPYGVMDMAGNVFEWTATQTNEGKYVLRGGGWENYYFRGRTTDRGTKLVMNFTNYDIGFRCAS